MDIISNNLEWIFGGIGVPIVYFILKGIASKSKELASRKTQTNNIVSENSVQKKGGVQEEVTKSQTRILFIDDKHTEFKMVSILKKSGWINTKSVKDVTDLDDPKILEAEIIFVDINGVGSTLFQDQGLGLASALKKKYSNKRIILYSAETVGDRFHKAIREVDDCLYKDAEPYQFINLIESFSKSKQ